MNSEVGIYIHVVLVKVEVQGRLLVPFFWIKREGRNSVLEIWVCILRNGELAVDFRILLVLIRQIGERTLVQNPEQQALLGLQRQARKLLVREVDPEPLLQKDLRELVHEALNLLKLFYQKVVAVVRLANILEKQKIGHLVSFYEIYLFL